MTTLIISNDEIEDEIEDIIKIVKSLGDSGLLLEEVTETVQNEVGAFLSMLLSTLCASLLGILLTGRGINSAGKGRGINRVGE